MNTTTTQRGQEQTLAMSIVIFANWLIAHLATSWAMPPEVQSAAQGILVVGIGAVGDRMQRREDARVAAERRLLASPDPRSAPDDATQPRPAV